MSEVWTARRGSGGQNLRGLVVTRDAVSAWFSREILPLEAILMRYLRQNWRNASDIPDLRQEIYARALRSAREHVPDNPRQFLLTSARNLLIDLVRREQIVPMETFADFEALEIASDEPQPDRALIAKDELRRMKAALVHLPPRTREAIELTYFEGLSCTQVAKRMGVAKQTASEFIAKGTLVLTDTILGASDRQSAKS
jgi:RNA polymerase sigma factor (sigma-70 family)